MREVSIAFREKVCEIKDRIRALIHNKCTGLFNNSIRDMVKTIINNNTTNNRRIISISFESKCKTCYIYV